VAALVDGPQSPFASYDYLSTWTSIAQAVREAAVRELEGRPRPSVQRAVEQAVVLNSVSNLMSFRWIAEKVKAGQLDLHAWWFNMQEGQLYAFNQDKIAFEPVLGVQLAPTISAGTKLADIGPERFLKAAAGHF
jgi:carbonic anhydrase